MSFVSRWADRAAPTQPPALVLGAARTRGPIARDEVAQLTSLSIATVNRQVTALQEAGLLRERPDLAASGAIGRPRVPVEVNHEPYLTLGLHIGARGQARRELHRQHRWPKNTDENLARLAVAYPAEWPLIAREKAKCVA